VGKLTRDEIEAVLARGESVSGQYGHIVGRDQIPDDADLAAGDEQALEHQMAALDAQEAAIQARRDRLARAHAAAREQPPRPPRDPAPLRHLSGDGNPHVARADGPPARPPDAPAPAAEPDEPARDTPDPQEPRPLDDPPAPGPAPAQPAAPAPAQPGGGGHRRGQGGVK
jgi:hypothetical protein